MADIRPLEISNEDPLEVHPVMDVVVREEFEPCPNMFPHTDGEILNDEKVIIHSSGSVGETKIFEPNTWVCLPSVFGDVGGWLESLWERCSLDMLAKGLWSRDLRARAPVIRPMSAPGARFTAPLDGSARICVPRLRTVAGDTNPGCTIEGSGETCPGAVTG